MTTVCFVGCTKRKLSVPARAENLYTPSIYFRLAARLAQKLGIRWYILSAKHGLLRPEQVIEPYEATLAGAAPAQIRAWSERTRPAVVDAIGDSDRVVFLCGRAYYAGLLPLGAGVEVGTPLAGVGMGSQMALMRRMLAA